MDVGEGCLLRRTGSIVSRTLVGFRMACEGREGSKVAVIFVGRASRGIGVGRSDRRMCGVCDVHSLGR